MIYRSGNFSLDTQSYVFERDGKESPVEPQVFDLLVYLIEHRDRVVTRNELLDNLWDGRIVSDGALNGRLKIARKAVGDDGKQQKIIKTIHRRGYQFIADIALMSEAAAQVSLPGQLQPSSSSKPSVAVLPFENLDQESDSDYFADGLIRDINANLCRYRELLVIDSHSAFEFRESHSQPEKFARELGVQYLVSGNIRRAGERVRISTQLTEAASGKMIWGDSLERTYDDVFELESEVAAKIAANLASHIEDESFARAAHRSPESMSAYDCVLRARRYADSYERDEIEAERALLERAIEIDGSFAAAYAWFAHSLVKESEAEWCESRSQALSRAVEFARKAVALDEFDAFAHMVLGWAYMYLEKLQLAETHLDRAIECNPNDYDAYCIKCWVLTFSGRVGEVAVCGTRALELNPLAPDDCLAGITMARYIDGDYAAALEMLERIRDPNEQSEALRAACLLRSGRESEARRAAQSAVELGGEFLQQPKWIEMWPFRYERDRQHFLDGLYQSGVLKDPCIRGQSKNLMGTKTD